MLASGSHISEEGFTNGSKTGEISDSGISYRFMDIFSKFSFVFGGVRPCLTYGFG